jgi:hypothetical protein
VVDQFGEHLFDVRGVRFRIAGLQCSRFHNVSFVWMPTGMSVLLTYTLSEPVGCQLGGMR